MTKAPQDIILAPVITEKSAGEIADGKYTFKVAVSATKTDVRNAVEKLFNVKVVSVNTTNYDGKLKRQGRFVGRTASYKKASVISSVEHLLSRRLLSPSTQRARKQHILLRAVSPQRFPLSTRLLSKSLDSASKVRKGV